MRVQLKALKYVIQNYKRKTKQIFLDNWTIRIRIFWRFRCREQVIIQFINLPIPDVSLVLKYAKILVPSVGLMSQFPILAPQKAPDR